MEPLTTAELRALHALARYEYATDAAKAAGISPQTLRNQAYRAYQKLGVNGRTEAFRKIGWLRPPRFMPTSEAPDPLRSGFDEAQGETIVSESDGEAAAPDLTSVEYLTAGHNRRARASAAKHHESEGR